MAVPPLLELYHFTLFPLVPGVAERLAVPAPQIETPNPVGAPTALTVAVTGTRALVLSQPVLLL